MMTVLLSLLTDSVDTVALAGGWITLIIDIVAAVIFLYKAIKSKNISLSEAIQEIRKIFSNVTTKTDETTDGKEAEEKKEKKDESIQRSDNADSDNLRK